MRINTVKGTNDYLPGDTALREYLQSEILKVYLENGYERIMTPAVEDIENLDKSEGGENLNLIFKILKRGEKLDKAIQDSKFDDLADMGLRYDLTLPLTRYFANNRTKLIMPFKCIQTDRVYRAERPQKGRLRELIQCDIDILGSSSIGCEIELIDVTARALLAIGIKDFKVKINDRRLLKSVLASMGFPENQLDSVCITFDKLSGIGAAAVNNELTQKGFDKKSIDNLNLLLEKLPVKLDDLTGFSVDEKVLESLLNIINSVKEFSEEKYDIEFDISLVRGQGYYTGTIFEIESRDFQSSIAGGGRYDNLIGKFIGEQIPAVGFSIGFERIFSILSERGFVIPNKKEKIAVLYDNDFTGAYKKAESLRSQYFVSLFEKPSKTGKFLNKLQENGFKGFLIFGQSEEVKLFEN